jgi:hypothetical protein
MKLLLLAILISLPVLAQVPTPTTNVQADPGGSCQRNSNMQYNVRTGQYWGCEGNATQNWQNGVWTKIAPANVITTRTTDPTGVACDSRSITLRTPSGALYSCVSGVYAAVAGSGPTGPTGPTGATGATGATGTTFTNASLVSQTADISPTTLTTCVATNYCLYEVVGYLACNAANAGTATGSLALNIIATTQISGGSASQTTGMATLALGGAACLTGGSGLPTVRSATVINGGTMGYSVTGAITGSVNYDIGLSWILAGTV